MLTARDVEKYLPANLPAIDKLDPCNLSQTNDTCSKEKPADGYLPYDSSSREKTPRLRQYYNPTGISQSSCTVRDKDLVLGNSTVTVRGKVKEVGYYTSLGEGKGERRETNRLGPPNRADRAEKIDRPLLAATVRCAYQKSRKNNWIENGKSSTFEFGRWLKKQPLFLNLTAEELSAELRTFIELSPEELSVLVREWPKIKFAMEETPLDRAARLASEHPLTNPPGRKNATYRNFLSIVDQLWAERTDDSIFFSVYDMGDKLGVTHQQVSNLRKRAIENHLLTEVAPYQVGRQATDGGRRATRFRFNAEQLLIPTIIADAGILFRIKPGENQ